MRDLLLEYKAEVVEEEVVDDEVDVSKNGLIKLYYIKNVIVTFYENTEIVCMLHVIVHLVI